MKFRISFFVFLFIGANAFGQKDFDDSSWSLKDRGYLGLGLGGLGLGTTSSGTTYFTIGVSGQAGYMLTKDLSAGIGLEYQYTSYGNKNHSNIYNGYPFIRYNIKNFFIQADYDYYNVVNKSGNITSKTSFNRFFTGVGYSSPTGNGGRFNFLVSYDLLYPNAYPYTSPLSTRFYFTF